MTKSVVTSHGQSPCRQHQEPNNVDIERQTCGRCNRDAKFNHEAR